MTSTPFMQLYVGDYLADTLDLTTEQHGAYLLLLMTMWRHDAKLPNDPAKLSRIARVSARRWHMVWSQIEHFFYVEGESIRNNRLDREHQKASSISEKRRASGAAGGHAKALKDNNAPIANATDLPQHSQKSDTREEKEEPNGSSKKRGSRLTADWVLPKAWGEWAMAEGLSEVCVRREADSFRDWWISATGAKASKLDWQATWRGWVRRKVDDQKRLMARRGASGGGLEIGTIREVGGVRKQYAGNGTGWLVIHE